MKNSDLKRFYEIDNDDKSKNFVRYNIHKQIEVADATLDTQAPNWGQVKSYSGSALNYAGSISFSELPSLPVESDEGKFWNIEDEFVTDNRFISGAGNTVQAHSNVAVALVNGEYKFDTVGGIFNLDEYYTKLEVDGKLNNKQDKYNFVRINANEVIEITDSVTEIFLYGGTANISSINNFKNLKSFYVGANSTIDKTANGTLTKINLDFTEHDLPYTFTNKAYFVGFTQNNCPLFRTDLNEQILQNQSNITTNDNNCVHKTGNETINGEKIFTENIKCNTYANKDSSSPTRILNENAVQLQAGGDALWLNSNDKSFHAEADEVIDLGKVDKSFKDTYSNKLITKTIQAISGINDNEPLVVKAPVIELTATETGNASVIKDKLILSGGDSSNNSSIYPFTNNIMDIGTTNNSFKNLYLNGKINDLTLPTGTKTISSTEDLLVKQDKYKFLRVQNETKEFTTDEYTDIFVISGTIKFSNISNFHNIKSLYVNKNVIFDTSGVTQINVDFKQHTLPYTFTNKAHFVGYTTDNIPLFISDNIIPEITLLYNTQSPAGTLTTEQKALYDEANEDYIKIKATDYQSNETSILHCQFYEIVGDSYKRGFAGLYLVNDITYLLYLKISNDGSYTFTTKEV